MELDPAVSLPVDSAAATLVGRAWVAGAPSGPAVIAVRGGEIYDITTSAPTMSALLEREDAVALARSAPGRPIGSVAELLRNSVEERRDASRPFVLAPCDLQVIKAFGVTFASSLIERLIEEQARGNPAQAEAVRARMVAIIGEDLRAIAPGAEAAMRLKESLVEQGLWSQYLEVGIGPNASIFTKSPVLSAIGSGGDIGLHPASIWSTPEPEVVLAINSNGHPVGATLGNDLTLRDFEGRSALLLDVAKDNNGSCAIGPFLRLFDDGFDMEDVRAAEVTVRVSGADGFTLEGGSSMQQISRDPLDLVAAAIGRVHQYPDGLMLFLGTMFAPIQDRSEQGAGFTHKLGDLVTIATPKLGVLVNRVGRSDQIAPWRFGIGALMTNLAQRGILAGAAG